MVRHIFQTIIVCLSAVYCFSQRTEFTDFAIKNTDEVNKIVITEKNGGTYALIKSKGIWHDEIENCVVQENVGLILDVFKKIEFKGFIPDSIIENYSNRDSIATIKVEIYQNSKWIKTWYIGPPTNDRNGQIMFLESKKSSGEIPVFTKMSGFVGTIEPRFFSDHKKWRCTTVFEISPEEIASVRVTNFENTNESFSVEIFQNDFQVYQDLNRLHISDSGSVYRYLGQFKKLKFERFDSELTAKQIDSLKATDPFLTIEIMNKSGFSKTLYCYRKPDKRSDNLFDENRFWCILPPYDELVICQYFVFNSIIKGEYYFPLSTIHEE